MPDRDDLPSRKVQARKPPLGRLELEVLRVLWGKGESSVRDVLNHLSRPLAYTTVMTTLDRLFKKGLLDRRMADRSFRYLPSGSDHSVEPGKPNVLAEIVQFRTSRELLISHLVDTVCDYDESLLAELEQNIAERRRQYEMRRKSE